MYATVGPTTRAPAGRRSRTAAAAAMPLENVIVSPPSSVPMADSSASHVGEPSSRE